MLSWWIAAVCFFQLGSSQNLLRVRNPNTTNPAFQYRGFVEVRHNSRWGTICNTTWTYENAFVACRTAGFNSAVRGLSSAETYFGHGIGLVWLDNVRCTGNEATLFECPNDGWGTHSSHCNNHRSDVGVVCSDDAAIRLVGGAQLSEGRVEIFHSNSWGTVCDDFWNINDANVVCKQLGYPTALEYITNARFGRGTGTIWLDNVRCNGTESHIADCPHNSWGVHNCGHYEDAGVRCADATFTQAYLPIRLVNGAQNSNNTQGLYSGNVEVWYNNTWGTVCDDSWGIEDAQIACRQLGFYGALIATSRGDFGRGSANQPIYLDQVTCLGDEPALSQCHHRSIGAHDCRHTEDAGVICQYNSSSTFDIQVRLIGDNSSTGGTFGRVEVNYNGVWGTVCDDLWDLNDARVVCRMLGFQDAIRAGTTAYSQHGTGPIWMDNLACQGNETHIKDCSFPGWGIHNCRHWEDALAVCDTTLPGDAVRLVGGATVSQGRVEIQHNGVWGTICNHQWNGPDATVVCQQLGFYGGARAISALRYGQALSGQRIWFDHMQCTGTESNLNQCRSTGPSTSCNHRNDAGVICIPSAYAIPVRLSNGTASSNGRVEINVNGRWGVICDFGWDIRDATVVCRQLGYIGAHQALRNAYYGAGTNLPIFTSYLYCRGTEYQLANCSGLHPNNIRPPSTYCRISDAAGVQCIDTTHQGPPPIRLNGSSNLNEGRVEILVQGQWGTVCDDYWSSADARVVCRQLGYPSTGAQAFHLAHFGQGTGRIVLDNVRCTGLEVYLTDCPSNPLNIHNCGHREDASVRCQTSSQAGTFNHPVRLITHGNRTASNEGTVEIMYNGTWGSVCDDYWGLSEARVVCRMLGYRDAIRGWSRAHFGETQGPIYLDDVRCSGIERELDDCSNHGVGVHNCQHREDAGVSCSNFTAPVYPIRLRGGGTRNQGRIEIQYNGTWGTVCDDGWNLQDGNVVCNQLGYNHASRVTTQAEFGRGRGHIWLDNVICRGTENSLDECDHNGWGAHNCRHSEDAGVVCVGERFPIRLVNGSSPAEGRVEVNVNGTWGTVCDDFWDILDAQVVCNQLGYASATQAYSFAHFGQGTGPIFMDNVACFGTENDLFQCSNNGLGVHNCHHIEDAGVACSNDTTTTVAPQPLRIRLVGGRNSSEGRVEVTRNGTWGTVCDDSWNIQDANVVCRQLGFERASAAISNALFGSGVGPIYLDDVRCFGNEASLDQCFASPWGVHNCRHYEDAGVRCYAPHQLVRLVGGSRPSEGRVEVFYRGEWGTICHNHWSVDDANVVCRELGFARAYSFPDFSTFSNGSGQIWLSDVNCTGTEDSIFQCQKSDWGIISAFCSHNTDAGAVCSNVPPNVHPIRLQGGSSSREGRVEIFYNNEWGTICDDHWTLAEANIVCKGLNFPGAVSAESVASNSRFSPGTGHIWLDEVQCSGSEYFIDQCSHDSLSENDCSHFEDAAVVCSPMTLETRLRGGNDNSSGRIEVNFNGQGWGTICDDLWGIFDADVACRMLGYKSSTSAPREAFFGMGIGTIWMDNVVCNGKETSLLDCSHAGFQVHNCQHREDAGVVCSNQAVCPSVNTDHGNFTFYHNTSLRSYENTVVKVSCNAGYTAFNGAFEATCASTGKWIRATPGCGVACRAFKVSPHLNRDTNDSYPATTVNFTCDENYSLQGAATITCQVNGSWSNPIPTCVQYTCKDPHLTNHLQGVGHGINARDTVSFTCDPGYHLEGVSFVSCLQTGAWNDSIPTCVAVVSAIKCKVGKLSPYLQASDSGVPVGGVVTFSCANGYLLQGSGGLNCISGGKNATWDSPLPTCNPAVVSAVGVISTGGLVGIILAALVVIVAAVVVTGLIIWQVAMRVSKQRGYRQLSVRAHVGDDARVNIYSSDQAKLEEEEEDGDEPLYTEKDDEQPLDL